VSGLFDTNILIDCLRGNTDAVRLVEQFKGTPSISVISELELLAGARSQSEEQLIVAFLALFRTVPVSSQIARRAGSFVRLYGASHSVELGDALIAATAEDQGLKLVTLNIKHFPMFRGLKRAY
jgi:predicted nucleic acid-binding protein